jgi:hypothetical protein
MILSLHLERNRRAGLVGVAGARELSRRIAVSTRRNAERSIGGRERPKG